jgi:hypothetical protein
VLTVPPTGLCLPWDVDGAYKTMAIDACYVLVHAPD